MQTKGPFIISTGGEPVATSKTPLKNTWPPFVETKKERTHPLGYTKKWWPPTYAIIMIIPNSTKYSIIEIWLTNGSS